MTVWEDLGISSRTWYRMGKPKDLAALEVARASKLRNGKRQPGQKFVSLDNIDAELWAQFRQRCAALNRPMSRVLQDILREFVKGN